MKRGKSTLTNHKRLDSRTERAYLAIMGKAKTNADKLSGFLEELTVAELDEQLVKLSRAWRRVYTNRQMLAAEQGDATPPPPPPMADEAAPQQRVYESKGRREEGGGMTWAGLAHRYKTEQASPYFHIRYATREHYDTLINRIVSERGDESLADVDGIALDEIYDRWVATGKLSMAHALMGMLRTLVNFGATALKDEDCERLAVPLHRKRKSVVDPRIEQQTPEQGLTEEQAKAIIDKAHEMGSPSMALAQAFQFDCKLRQKDVIGEWVPKSEPGESDTFLGEEKWLRGLRWEEIDENYTLRHVTSQGRKKLRINLRDKPLVMKELDRYLPRPESGPMVINERTRVPWQSANFRHVWRDVARACGISDQVKNMDSRGGATRDATAENEEIDKAQPATAGVQIASRVH
jgi:hypothetical protein